MRSIVALAMTLPLLGAAVAVAAPPEPWAFDMSPEQVESVTDFGPYKRFSNGDVETYKGVFNGREENFQFFFQDHKLRRIGVYLYEGEDLQAAAGRWRELHSTIERTYGSIATPGNASPVAGDQRSEAEFADRAASLAEKGVKTQMLPAVQPRESHVFSSFFAYKRGGGNHYLVILYFDRPS